MQPYDIAMIAVLATATLFGFLKGMVRQLASLTSLIAGYFLALRLSPWLADYIHQPPPMNRFIAMLLIYLATGLAIWLVSRKVSQIIDRAQLKDFDRQVGALFGAAKGALLCLAITFFAVSLSAACRQTVLQSRSGEYIARLLHHAGPVMPKETHDLLDPYLNQLERQLTPAAADEHDDRRSRPSLFGRDLRRPN